MSPSRDIPKLIQPWHLDCRLESKLPEDRVVGTRFLTNTVLAAVTSLVVVLAAWLAVWDVSLRRQISSFDERFAASQPELRSVKQLQAEYLRESAKIDQAYAQIYTPLFVSGFMAELGRTRPDRMTIDIVESTEPGTVYLRGSLREASERATRIAGQYVDTLRKNPQISAACREIRLTGLDRSPVGDDLLNLEITFRLR
jgi:hypothetical protein